MSSSKPRRRLRSFVVFVVVVAVLAIAADRVAEWVAEDRLATVAANEAAQYDVRAAGTSVEVGGFGFLPQVARERFSKVTMTMDRPTIESVPAESLTVDLDSVHVPRALLTGGSGAVVTVDSATVRLRLSPAELTRVVARRVAGFDKLTLGIVDGKLQAQVSIRGVEVGATVRPEAQNGRIRLLVDQLDAEVPAIVREQINRLLARGVQLPAMPFEASLRGVSVEGQSVVLVATAADLRLAG